jgi:excisionase family DNA binding protein
MTLLLKPEEAAEQLRAALLQLMKSGTLPTLLLTTDEAAEQLRVGRDRVFELMRTGQLKSVKIGGSRRIRAADLEEYVASLPTEGPTS